MKLLVFIIITIVFAIAPATGQNARARPANGTGGGNASIAQGILGFGVPSGPTAPEPCVGTGIPGACYGVPSGLLVVPTDLLVLPGTAGVFYVSIETANFSGTGSTTFQLTESGSVVLQLTVDGSVISANTKTIIGQAGAIPAGTYTGPATLSATTTATPQVGGSPVTLTAYTSMWIVPPGTAGADAGLPAATGGALGQIAQGIVGFGIVSSPAPCVGTGRSGTCYGVPSRVLALPLNLIDFFEGGVYYVVVETAAFSGYGSTKYQLVEGGKVALQFTSNDEVFPGNKIITLGAGGEIPPGTYAGPAALIATTSITPRNGGNMATVKGGITLQIIQ